MRAGCRADGALTPLRRCDLGGCAGGWRRQTGGSGISIASSQQSRRWRIVLQASGRRSSANPRFCHLRGRAQSRLAAAQPKAAVSQTACSLGAEPPAEAADRPVLGAEWRCTSIPRRLRPARRDRFWLLFAGGERHARDVESEEEITSDDEEEAPVAASAEEDGSFNPQYVLDQVELVLQKIVMPAATSAR